MNRSRFARIILGSVAEAKSRGVRALRFPAAEWGNDLPWRERTEREIGGISLFMGRSSGRADGSGNGTKLTMLSGVVGGTLPLTSVRRVRPVAGRYRVTRIHEDGQPPEAWPQKGARIIRPTGGNFPVAYRRRESCDCPPIPGASLRLKFRGPLRCSRTGRSISITCVLREYAAATGAERGGTCSRGVGAPRIPVCHRGRADTPW
jgi:hypothetical protein